MKIAICLITATLIALASVASYIGEVAWPIAQEDLSQPRIYAYRDWQSVGVQVQQGDRLTIKADGNWLYTPDEYHGPEGSRRYQAPSFYPLPHVPGGALIGRIGEQGQPFYVGQYSQFEAQTAGLFYLRIDDDILSDNEGWVAVDVTLEREVQGEY